VDALRRHPPVVDVQKVGWALRSVCAGDDAAGLARKQRVAEAGGVEAVPVVDALWAVSAAGVFQA